MAGASLAHRISDTAINSNSEYMDELSATASPDGQSIS